MLADGGGIRAVSQAKYLFFLELTSQSRLDSKTAHTLLDIPLIVSLSRKILSSRESNYSIIDQLTLRVFRTFHFILSTRGAGRKKKMNHLAYFVSE